MTATQATPSQYLQFHGWTRQPERRACLEHLKRWSKDGFSAPQWMALEVQREIDREQAQLEGRT